MSRRNNENEQSLLNGLYWYLETELIPAATIETICINFAEIDYKQFETTTKFKELPMQQQANTLKKRCLTNKRINYIYKRKDSVVV